MKLVKNRKLSLALKNVTIDFEKLDMTRTIKKVLDPNLIWNQGKIFTADGNGMEFFKTREDFR